MDDADLPSALFAVIVDAIAVPPAHVADDGVASASHQWAERPYCIRRGHAMRLGRLQHQSRRAFWASAWADELWIQHCGRVSSARRLYRSHPQGSKPADLPVVQASKIELVSSSPSIEGALDLLRIAQLPCCGRALLGES